MDAIPINFLTPIPGTPLSPIPPIDPLDMLLTVAMFRLVHPSVDLRIAGGRPLFGSLQAFLFMAGANGLMSGDLLTIKGQDIKADLNWISQLGFVPNP